MALEACLNCMNYKIACVQERKGQRDIYWFNKPNDIKWMTFLQEIKACQTQRQARLASLQVIRQLQKGGA